MKKITGTTYQTFIPGVHDEEVLKLRAVVWGSDHLHTDPLFFEWLFQKNPASDGKGIVVIKDGRVVGFAGMVIKDALYLGEEVSIAYGLDFMVHPDVRASMTAFRITKKWIKMAKELGCRIAVVFPNEVSHNFLTDTKVGFIPVVSPLLKVRPLRGITIGKELFPAVPSSLLTLSARVLDKCTAVWAHFKQGTFPQGSPSLITEFDERFDKLWSLAYSPDMISIRRDAQYLNWRYNKDFPTYSYIRIAWTYKNEVLGYVILSPREINGIKTMLLVDVLVNPEIPFVLDALIHEAMRQTTINGRGLFVAQAMPSSELQKSLSRLGCLSVPDKVNPKAFTLTALNLGVDSAQLLSPSRWYLTWGDMEVV